MIGQSYRVIFAILMGFVACMGVMAQPYCRVHTFDIHDGLPSNSIAGLAQSSDNLMWVSTWNGLCYYDGYQFFTYRDGGDNGTLSSNRLRTVDPDDNGHVWLFSYDRVLHVLDTHTGRYTNLSEIIARKTGSEFLGRNSYSAANRKWITGDGTSIAVRASVYDPLNPDSLEVYDASEHCAGSRLVHKVVYDSDGNEWIFSDRGIHLYGTDVSQEGRFVDVRNIGGMAYMVTSDGHLYAYSPQGRSLRPMPSPEWLTRVNRMLAYDDRNLLFGTGSGIAVFNVGTRTWRRIASGNVSQIFLDSQGRIWAFSDVRGVMLTDIHGAEEEVFTSSPEGDACTGSTRPVWVEDKYGVVWTVPTGGVFGYFDENARRIVPYPLDSPKFGRKSIPDIEKFYVDSQCNMWITSPHDLILLNFGHYNVMRLPLVQNADTRSIVALHDGTVLAGSHSGVIGCFDTDGSLKGYLSGSGGRMSLVDRPVRFSERIYMMFQDSRRRLWIGTKGDGLYVVEPDGAISHYMPSATDRYALNSENVYDVDQSPSGRIWIATYGGGVNYVDESDDGRIRFINASNDMTSYPIDLYANSRRITHTPDGVLLLSTTGGLLTFSDSVRRDSEIKFFKTNHVSGDVTSLRTNDVMQVLAARDGTVYVTTMGGEMQRVIDTGLLHDGLKFASMSRGSDGSHMSYYAPEGGGIRSMIEDVDGNICVVRETSLVLYDVARDRMTVYGPNDLGENLEFTEALPELIPSTGCMWLPTVGGIVSFHPNDITKSDFSPNIVFTGVQFQGESEKHHILNTDRIDVDVDRRNLAISFAALDFSDKYLLQYAYRLDDDKEWNYLQGSNTVQFTGLGPGLHRLRVKSTNSDGVWLDNESAIDIYVKPSFSETPWAILLYVLIATFVVWAAMHFYFLRKRNAMLSDLRHKESEFYTDVSHKLRTPLTLIGAPVKEVLATESLSDTARGHLEMVERNSGRMLTLVDEMLRKSHDKGVYISDETAMTANVTSGSVDTVVNAASEASLPAHHDIPDDPSRDTILVVEDNDDLRSFLTDILSSQYNVLSASNGREGLETAEARQPDFILTDVTMPEMDGLTMVRNIKSNKHLSHIPIIVLSAKASEQDRVLGLREGIDDYVTKPFSATYLRQRIANIIAQRHMLQQSYLESLGAGNAAAVVQNPLPADEGDVTPEEMADVSSEAPAKPDEYRLDSPQVVDADKEMMATLMAFINDHLDEEGLKIEELADAVNLGRTVFYGKIKALVGMTPSDFLRRMRMQRAEELIVKTRMNFSEIAFKVGFSDPKYFTKCFKKEIGMTPSEYRQKSLL